MGILDSVERGLERAVNGAFARTFRSGVQPVEIAAALKKELDIDSVVVDRDRVLAPNRFVVRVSPKDAVRLQNLGGTLENELRSVVSKHARRQSYQLLGEPDVQVQADDSLTPGVLEIDASRVEGAVSWVPTLDVDGHRHELQRGTTTIGRGSDCGIRISDNAASRKHLEIIWDGSAGIVRDLGSTNGSKINGQRFREAALSPGTVITVGQTSLTFQLSPGRSAPASSGARSTRSPRAAAPSPGNGSPQQTNRSGSQSAPAPRSSKAQQAAERSAPSRAPHLSELPSAGSRGSKSGDAPGLDQDFWSGL